MMHYNKLDLKSFIWGGKCEYNVIITAYLTMGNTITLKLNYGLFMELIWGRCKH